METNRLYYKDALNALQEQKDIIAVELEFNEDRVSPQEAALLGKHGFHVPENRIEYPEDGEIPFDKDNLPISELDLQEGRVVQVFHAEVPLKKEVADWAKNSDIDLNSLMGRLVEDFFRNMPSVNYKQGT